MAPKPKKQNKASSDQDAILPLNASVSAAVTDYAQAQSDEIEALQAIFMDDYQDVATKGAWNLTKDRSFKLILRAFSDSSVNLVINVTITATYPKTLPLITLGHFDNVRTSAQTEIKNLIIERPKELLGEVMMYDLATSIQEKLEDEALNKATDDAMPALDEERAAREAAASTQAQQDEERQQQKAAAAKAEEDRVLQQMVDEELIRRNNAKKKSRQSVIQDFTEERTPPSDDTVHFDRPSIIAVQGSDLSFKAVSGCRLFRKTVVTSSFTASPVTQDKVGLNDDDPIIVPGIVIKRASIPASSDPLTKQRMLLLEDELEKLRQIPRTDNIANLLNYKIDLTPNSWNILVAMDFGDQGTLSKSLKTYKTIPLERAKAWTIELLEAIDFYHRNGIVHHRIHVRNVLLCEPEDGPIYTKLADAGFQESLHDIINLSKSNKQLSLARSAYWSAPETSDLSKSNARKTDIWDMGIVFIEMLFGLTCTRTYSSPSNLMDAADVSEALEDLIRLFFKNDDKKRPSAFDLLPSEFLRTDATVHSRVGSPALARGAGLLTHMLSPDKRIRRGSNMNTVASSRYAAEWIELGRLGKGGYGEVVKARNKVDSRMYAIKKIKQRSGTALSATLSEVMLLSRLNHPYVVRYYGAWHEDDFSFQVDDHEDSITESTEGTDTVEEADIDQSGLSPSFEQSTGGLDFISSSGYPKIEFGLDSDDEGEHAIDSDESSDSEDDSGSDIFERDITPSQLKPSSKGLAIRRTTSSTKPRPVKTTLYIQMELCERQTLRDLIRKDLYDNVEEGWRLLRQIVEGLVHIHGHGIIHRDLKPDNIFIDGTNKPQIGDFGLATSERYQQTTRVATGSYAQGEMTRSIGTALYVAPEISSSATGSYNDKVDMYSLGIILFEMCFPLKTAMERDQVIRGLRQKEHTLPDVFKAPEKVQQGKVILALIGHRQSERPSSVELLRSGNIPVQIGDETVKLVLHSLSDPSSVYYQGMMTTLFSPSADQHVKYHTWDLLAQNTQKVSDAQHMILSEQVRDTLAVVFRRHGAVKSDRQYMLPASSLYENNNAVKVLDPSGALVQLPYDLTLPFARAIAHQKPVAMRTYAFGTVFRSRPVGGGPQQINEVDFDIVSQDTLDLGLREAEVIKVLDEVIDSFPCFSTVQTCFHINHSDLLNIILDFCQISLPQRTAVKEVLSKLGVGSTNWPQVRNELRSPSFGISATVLDDLQKFDFRDLPEKAFARISTLLQSSPLVDKTSSIFNHLGSVTQYTKAWRVKKKVYLMPLSCANEKFYTGGILLQALLDSKNREVLAAGGRYDRLIEEHRPRGQGEFTGCRAVGFHLGWDRIVNSMARYVRGQSKSSTFLRKQASNGDSDQRSAWTPRGCDILVAASDPSLLRSTGLTLLDELWAGGLSAELAGDAQSTEQLVTMYRNHTYSFIVTIKQDNSTSSTLHADLRVRNLVSKQTDYDVKSENIVGYLRAELRERDNREGQPHDRAKATLTRQASDHHHSGLSNSTSNSRNEVQVLLAQHRSKKSNKWGIIEAAQQRVSSLLLSYARAPIAAIETRDDILDMLRGTRLSDPESWRKVVQNVPLSERNYVQEIQDLLEKYRQVWMADASGKTTSGEEEMERIRVAYLYNFRTGAVILYDLGL